MGGGIRGLSGDGKKYNKDKILKNSMEVPKKELKIELPYDIAIPFLDIY